MDQYSEAINEQGKKKGNPKWVKGGASPNPSGRNMRHSVKTTRGLVERFLKRNLSTIKVQSLYDKLEAKDKLNFLCELLPYILAKPQAGADMDLNRLNDTQLDELYNKVIGAAQSGIKGAA